MSEAEGFGDPVVPIEVLVVDIQQVAAGDGLDGGVQDVKRLVHELAQLAETLIHRADIGGLFAGPGERRA